jgi:hypothetical protein
LSDQAMGNSLPATSTMWTGYVLCEQIWADAVEAIRVVAASARKRLLMVASQKVRLVVVGAARASQGA